MYKFWYWLFGYKNRDLMKHIKNEETKFSKINKQLKAQDQSTKIQEILKEFSAIKNYFIQVQQQPSMKELSAIKASVTALENFRNAIENKFNSIEIIERRLKKMEKILIDPSLFDFDDDLENTKMPQTKSNKTHRQKNSNSPKKSARHTK